MLSFSSHIPFSGLAFLAVCIFAAVHLWAQKITRMDGISHSRFLSAGGGVAIAYVFIDLLPKLSKNSSLVQSSLEAVFPYFERHVYVMALAGFLLFFAVDRSQVILKNPHGFFWLSMSSYALFNFLVGYAVVDPENPEVQPLFLFTFAMALHYFMNDFALSEAHGNQYRHFGKWLLIACLFLGWFAGLQMQLSQTAVALVSAFIGGGVIMNVTRHELPSDSPHSLGAFLLSALLYSIILLSIG